MFLINPQETYAAPLFKTLCRARLLRRQNRNLVIAAIH